MLCAVADTAATLFAVGGPALAAPTVTMVELAVDAATADVVSVAPIVALAPAVAFDETVTTPEASTVAMAAFEVVNASPAAGSILVEPSL